MDISTYSDSVKMW